MPQPVDHNAMMRTLSDAQMWEDVLLTWNPDDFNGVDNVPVPATSIWRPDIILYNKYIILTHSCTVMSLITCTRLQ